MKRHMKRNMRRKTTIAGLLVASCIEMILSGCAADEQNADDRTAGQEISETAVQTPEPVENTSAITEPAGESEVKTDSADTQETARDPQELYEQFLDNVISATFNINYPENVYANPIFEKGNSYTLTELGEGVSRYFLDSEYTDKTSYDYMQYTYVTCPDSADADGQNLLIKFVGLNIYTSDDDSYAVFVVTEDNGQLYVTGEYECWARSETTAYANGVLRSRGSGGAGDNYNGVSVILSNGEQATIYGAEILNGWWTSYVNDTIYNEVFDVNENAEASLMVSIYTIGDDKYYLYDMSECSEEEKVLCEDYINRCREGAGINWVTEDEIQTAVRARCDSVGVDYSITQQQEEAVWKQ